MHPSGYTWSKEYLEQLFNRLNMFSVGKTSERHRLTGTNNKTWLVQFSTANVNSQRKASDCLPNTQIEKKKMYWCHAEAESGGIKIPISA